MNFVSFGMILCGVLLNACAQLLLKAGTRAIGVIGGDAGWWFGALSAIQQPFILAGLLCYVLSVGIWIVALSRVDVSIAYPMLSIGYVVNALLASWFFGEVLTATKLTGIGVILVGVVILTRA